MSGYSSHSSVCPLCAHERAHPSWLGSTYYQGREFRYSECLACGSHYCDPMPDSTVLAQMYGMNYSTAFVHDDGVVDCKEPWRVLEWLRTTGPGTFIDYGCGSGVLLSDARQLGWRAIGVEFDSEVASQVRERTGAEVVTDAQTLLVREDRRADVLHLGDVIEHLTALDDQIPLILRLLRPGGTLIAQGPLEANACLFTLALRTARALRPARRTEMAPYHVLLATVTGQRTLFRRMGLEEVLFSISEVDWPAPSRLRLAPLMRPRAVALFCLRRVSQAISAVRPAHWGNRYFYVGRWPGEGVSYA